MIDEQILATAKEVFKIKYHVLKFRDNLMSEGNKLFDGEINISELIQMILSNKIKRIYVVIE